MTKRRCEDEDTCDNERKTGKVIPGASNLDPLTVRSMLPTPEAVKRYDIYLKEHKARLRQLERLARGELTPCDEWYT